MEMHQVRYFLALCGERNFSRAAKRCGVAQPSLSRAINLLEKEVGGSLFERNGRGATLWPLGRALRRHFVLIGQTALNIARISHSTVQPESREACGVHKPLLVLSRAQSLFGMIASISDLGASSASLLALSQHALLHCTCSLMTEASLRVF